VIITIFLTLYSQPKLKERIVFHTLNLILQIDPENKITENTDLLNFFKNEEYKDFKITYFSSEHRDHALISIKMFNENKLFGKGIKMFRIFCSKKENYINERACTTHSHSILLTFVSELGIIGLIFLLMIYFFLIKNIYKSHSNTQRVVLITILIYLLPGIPSGYFFNNFFSMILYTLVGIYLGEKKRKNNLISYD
jgi:cell division protein FtsW (lipid II flippase)